MTGVALGLTVLVGTAFGLVGAIGVAVVVLAVVLTRPQPGQLAAPALAVLVAVGVGAWRGGPVPPVSSPPWVDGATAVRGQVATAPVGDGVAQRFFLRVEEVEDPRGWSTADGCLSVLAPPLPEASLGDRVWLVGAARPATDAPIGVRTYLRSRRCGASLVARMLAVDARGSGWRRAAAGARRDLSRDLRRFAPGDAGALLSGLVTGDDHSLSSERQRGFLATGTTHITAVSGSNIALVVGLLVGLGSVGGVRRRFAWQAVTVAGVWAYAALVGLEPPVVRAGLVATAAVFAGRLGRRPDPITLVVLAGAVMGVAGSDMLWSLSFRLSLVASLAIAAVMPTVPPEGRFGWLRVGVVATLAAQMATLPAVLLVSPNTSLVSVPANLLIAPLVSVAFPTAALAAVVGLAWPPLGASLAVPAAICAQVIFLVVDTLAVRADDLGVSLYVPRAVLIGLSEVAAAGVTAMSEDGRQWACRAARATGTAPPATRLAAAAALLGAAAAVSVELARR